MLQAAKRRRSRQTRKPNPDGADKQTCRSRNADPGTSAQTAPSPHTPPSPPPASARNGDLRGEGCGRVAVAEHLRPARSLHGCEAHVASYMPLVGPPSAAATKPPQHRAGSQVSPHSRCPGLRAPRTSCCRLAPTLGGAPAPRADPADDERLHTVRARHLP